MAPSFGYGLTSSSRTTKLSHSVWRSKRPSVRAILSADAFVGRSTGFPARNRLTLNVGTAFAGQTVRVRFRIGTDEAASDFGWELDSLTFEGITNLPFSQLVEDRRRCNGMPKTVK